MLGEQDQGDDDDWDSDGELQWRAKLDITAQLAQLDAEIKSVADQLEPLQQLHTSLNAERTTLESRLQQLSSSRAQQPSKSSTSTKPPSGVINYQESSFPWSGAINSTLRRTFDLPSFRLCQEGVINAAMDGRDILCVMPTGGGKSLTYQLPAVIGAKGLTVVISPLLALIWDQIRALKELGIECAMFTGSTSKEEQNQLYRRLEDGARDSSKEIRLCYVTPEKIAKSKRLMSVLEKVNSRGRLSRFVIDEAHCCSQLGHDFRPDYKKLAVLKTLFPRVPIQAVTATLSIKTMPDLLKILRLPPICDGNASNATGTVFFSAPLYRPNLHYQVLSKPSSAKAAIEVMSNWIIQNHPDESGIIYCLSKKDTETVAEALRDASGGQIKTGVYHAGIEEYEKERIHIRWRKGEVNCICATIAFGLGIDKGDVRYVIHHSMSKSLEGYYQETGRAGRDGKDSDCVLFYRGQDSSRLASLIYGDVDGTSKLQKMLEFAQDLQTCRKVAFAKYFSTSANLSTNAWDHADNLSSSSGTVAVCGQCDNCRRDPSTIVSRNVTLETWQILKVLEKVNAVGGRLTLGTLADIARGLGGGGFTVRKGKGKDVAENVDINNVAGGKVELNRDDTELLLIQLTLLGYLAESYSANAYSVNVYLIAGPNSIRLSRFSRTQIQGGSGPQIECTFLNPVKRKKTKSTKAKEDDEADSDVPEAGNEIKSKVGTKRKRSSATKGKRKGKGAARGDEEEVLSESGFAPPSDLPEFVGEEDSGEDDDDDYGDVTDMSSSKPSVWKDFLGRPRHDSIIDRDGRQSTSAIVIDSDSDE